MLHLFTPWRLPYVMSPKAAGECPLCAAQRAADPAALILHRARHNFVILNLYPYTSGHLMIVPYRHVADLTQTDAAERAEMIDLAATCQRILEKAYHAEGFNVGMNLGKEAGAGVAGHIHMHLVPRWSGDTNFMSVVADTRVVPEDPSQSYEKLKPYFNF